MVINNLNHKINRKQMVKDHRAYLEEEYASAKAYYWECKEEYGMYAADCMVDDIRVTLGEQEELYVGLVATPVGAKTPYHILVW